MQIPSRGLRSSLGVRRRCLNREALAGFCGVAHRLVTAAKTTLSGLSMESVKGKTRRYRRSFEAAARENQPLTVEAASKKDTCPFGGQVVTDREKEGKKSKLNLDSPAIYFLGGIYFTNTAVSHALASLSVVAP